jgi:lysozyme
MKINTATLELIKRFESLHDGDLSVIGLQPKQCPAGVWTVGYGHALRGGDGHFLRGKEDEQEAYLQYGYLTEQGAEALLLEDTEEFAADVERLLLKKPTENQFGAMVSLAYNIGINAFAHSSVMQFFNQGQMSDAADAFLSWNKGTVKGKKVVLNGLVRRRQAERLLFISTDRFNPF